MNLLERQAQLAAHIEHLVEERKAWGLIPYGAAQTFCPDGDIWKVMNAGGEWHQWTNKPWQWEFLGAGRFARHRLLSGGNRVGKTILPEVELVFHLTADYPDWWHGFRFDEPITAWEWATSNEKSRDVQQKALLGPGGGKGIGGGLLPKSRVLDVSFRQCGLDNVIDTVKVRWGKGRRQKTSFVKFKTYAQGMEAAQGESVPWIRLDEELDPNNKKHNGIFGECLARLLDCDGFLTVTRTPLAGNLEMSAHFAEASEGRWMTTAGYWYDWTDVPHLSEKARRLHIGSVPEHEQAARCRGEEKLGSGLAFTFDLADVMVEPFEPPRHWFWILGHDFGLGHPAGSCKLGIDRVNDVWHLVWSHKKAGEEIPYHVATLRAQGAWIPVSWPHDGHKRQLTTAGAQELHRMYREAGANMLGVSARYKNDVGGGQSSEPVLEEINNRARTGRFKIWNCNETLPFREEMRTFHRDDRGILVAMKDDVIKSVFYAAMMQRYAIQKDPAIAGSVYKGPIAA